MEGLHIRLDEQAPPKFLMQYDWLSQQQLDVLFFETSWSILLCYCLHRCMITDLLVCLKLLVNWRIYSGWMWG